MANKDPGKIFEQHIEDSSKHQKVYNLRVRDVFIPFHLRHLIDLPPNKYDFLLAHSGIVLPLELKSVNGKSLPFANIEDNQIKALTAAREFDDTYPGFLFNYRPANNATFYLHINDFLIYQGVANGDPSPYKSKINVASIPIGVCEEVGILLDSKLLKVHYRYDIKGLFQKVVEKYR